MALKDLYKMTKADRYTADGCEELNKAREAATEDARRTYKNGEISETTGLMKTPNGWVKPKNGKQPGAKKENPTHTFEFKAGPDGKPVAGSGKKVKTYKTKKEAEAALKKQNAAPANKTTIRQGPNTKTLNETPAEHVQKNLDAYKGYQPYDMEELVLKPSGYERQTSARVPGGGQSITYTKNGAEDITLFFDKHGELENADVAGSKSADFSDEDKIKILANYMHRMYKDVPVSKWVETYTNKSKNKEIDINEKFEEFSQNHTPSKYAAGGEFDYESKDAAPRILTGDTKIRVRK